MGCVLQRGPPQCGMAARACATTAVQLPGRTVCCLKVRGTQSWEGPSYAARHCLRSASHRKPRRHRARHMTAARNGPRQRRTPRGRQRQRRPPQRRPPTDRRCRCGTDQPGMCAERRASDPRSAPARVRRGFDLRDEISSGISVPWPRSVGLDRRSHSRIPRPACSFLCRSQNLLASGCSRAA